MLEPVGPWPFVILDYPAEATSSIPYVETVAGDLYLEKGSDVETCNEVWRYMADRALTGIESTMILTQIMKTYEEETS